jgi:rubrerythrin
MSQTTTQPTPHDQVRAVFEEIPPFQLDKFLAASKPLDLSGITLEDAANYPLSDSEVAVIRYMQDTELYTVHYMKALLETSALADTECRAFLVCWGYEECFHGRALARILEVCGHEPSKRSIEEFARPRKLTEVLQDAGGRLLSMISPDFVAVHNTWGAINELTAVHAYTRLAELSANPVLAAVCRRLVKDERRHFAFYYAQARRRLRSPLAMRMTAFAIRSLWEPVGGSMAPRAERDFVGYYLFDDADGRARLAEVDSTIAKLPGMEWFQMVSNDVAEGNERMRRAGVRVVRNTPVAEASA